jgi:hypothetical protein
MLSCTYLLSILTRYWNAILFWRMFIHFDHRILNCVPHLLLQMQQKSSIIYILLNFMIHTEYSDQRPCDQEKVLTPKKRQGVAIKNNTLCVMRRTIFRFSFPHNHHHRCEPLLSDLRVHVDLCAAKTSVGVQADALPFAL